MIFDIAVVGAGPSGLIFVKKLLGNGLNIIMFEEHSEIGVPNHCTGIVSIRGINSLRIDGLDKSVENRFRGAIIYPPNCETKLYVWRKEWQAYLINRPTFDKIIYQNIADEVNIRFKESVIEIFREKGLWKIKTNRDIYYSKILVDDEGARYNIVRKLGLKPPGYRNILPAIQFEMSNVRDIDEDFVEIFFGEKWAPGFFGWIAPKDENKARVGLAVYRNFSPRKFLEKMVKHHPIASKKLSHAKIDKILGGIVVVNGPLKKTYGNHFLLIGDAGGFTKPTTGGGVVIGGKISEIAGEVVLKGVKENDFSEKMFREFEYRWRKRYGKNFIMMKLLRKIIYRLSDKSIDKLFLKLKESEGEELITKYGDIDEQKKLIYRSILYPKISIYALYLEMKSIFERPSKMFNY